MNAKVIRNKYKIDCFVMRKYSPITQITALLLIFSIAFFYLTKTFHHHDEAYLKHIAECCSASHEKSSQSDDHKDDCAICKVLFMPVVISEGIHLTSVSILLEKYLPIQILELATPVLLSKNSRAPPF